MAFASRLAELIKEKFGDKHGWRTKAANGLGISSSQLTRYLSGQQQAGSDILIGGAVLFECSTDYLLGISPSRGEAPRLDPMDGPIARDAPPPQIVGLMETLKTSLKGSERGRLASNDTPGIRVDFRAGFDFPGFDVQQIVDGDPKNVKEFLALVRAHDGSRDRRCARSRD